MIQQEEWFTNWFDSLYYHLLYKNRDADEAKLFLNNLVKVLQPKKGSKMLDLACGKGRHSIYLSKMGYSVTGVDLSTQSIEAAKVFENEKLAFYQHDMRHPFRSNYFDFIFNLFTSFGYFEMDADNLTTLKNCRDGLKPDGKFVLDFMNAEKVKKALVPLETKEVEKIKFKIERKVENGFIIKDIRFHDIRDYHFTEKVRALNLEDFQSLFAKAGLEIENVYGNYDLMPFDVNYSPRLILLSSKNA